MFSITSKYFSCFNNKPPVSCVTHLTRDFLTQKEDKSEFVTKSVGIIVTVITFLTSMLTFV